MYMAYSKRIQIESHTMDYGLRGREPQSISQ